MTLVRWLKNPISLVMGIPVPWVFVLAYLAGVGLEYLWPLKLHPEAQRSISIAGGVLFAIGAGIAGCVGLALAYLGEAGMLRQVWPVLVLPLAMAYLNWMVIPVEESRLREVFQSTYAEYCASVRRWI